MPFFAGKETYIDPITGQTLHKNQTAAQKKYHMKNAEGENLSKKWAAHAAETDHVNALKDAHDIAKHNPYLSDADFKEIMNSEENYRILPKSLNASKGEKSDWQVITDPDAGLSLQGRVNMAKEKVSADIALQAKFAVRTAQNMGGEFIVGSKDALCKSVIPLTVEASKKLVEVAQGKKELSEAATEMGKLTVDVAVAGGTNKLLVDAATFYASKNPALQKIANNNTVTRVIAVAMIVKDSAVRYVNGEISGEQFIDEVGEKGVNMVAGMIGGTVGRELGFWIGVTIGSAVMPGAGTFVGAVAGEVIGEVIGAMIATVACSAVMAAYRSAKFAEFKLHEQQIKMIEEMALKEMSFQRNSFKEIVIKEYKKWDENIQLGFDMLISSACEETFNLQGITEGLDTILSVFGKEVAFKSLDEYESQLGTTLKLSY